MLPYLHTLIHVEEDGSLHALGAFTTKEMQLAYQKDAGLEDCHVRLDFYNGPFNENIQVIYAGHRRWNLDKFQLAGYFQSEGEGRTLVTQEGYISVLRIDTTYQEEKALQKEALDRYAKLQRRWRLATYEELVKREGAKKARADIKLRFYEDALESFKPKTRRDVRALYAFLVLTLCLPLAISYFLSDGPEFGENLDHVSWLPEHASDISFYRSKQVQVFEFQAKPEDFKRWAESRGMRVRRLVNQEVISRYKAYIPTSAGQSSDPITPSGALTNEQFTSWQDAISAKVAKGLIAESPDKEIAIYDITTQRAYYEYFINL